MDLRTLLALIKEGLEEQFPGRVWIKAEISSIQVRTNGHCYMELSQNDEHGTVAKARAVAWRGEFGMISAYFAETTGSPLRAGMEVLLLVQISYSELYGLSLVVHEIDPAFTVGAAELEKKRTIAKLTEDGLMDRQKELRSAELPYRLAVISAPDAAGFGDFRRHLLENEYGFAFEVSLFEATMQGEAAPGSIIDALGRVESATEPYDAILVLRGGGSALDLACFDDYGLCMAIAECSIPVYTAIGHDRDRHIADMVAFGSVKTPTALADEFIDCYMAEDSRLEDFSTRLRMAFLGKISLMETSLAALEARIKSADPRQILSRGYSLATDSAGVVLKSAAPVACGDAVSIRFSDGVLDCIVTGKR